MVLEFDKNVLKEIITLKKEVTCTICLDLFTEPITLTSCQHTFCLECFKELISDKKNTKSVLCPLCKKITKWREYYSNVHFADVVEVLKKLDNMHEEDDSDDDIYDRVNRMKRFLDDCMIYKEYEEISISSADDSDNVLLNKPEEIDTILKSNNRSLLLNSKPSTSKTPVRKTKTLNCSKIKGKHAPKRSKKVAENDNISDALKIEEYDSPGIYEQNDEENKIVKLLEDDCLRNLENEIQNINKSDDKENEFQNPIKKTQKNKRKQSKRNESNNNHNLKSGESSSSRKTNTSTGWSRMKTMKKQLKKKEIKYKQLNVSTEINKSKTKSPQDSKNSTKKEAVVILNRLNNNMSINHNKSVDSKIEKGTPDKSIENKTIAQTQEDDDVFTMCTQKLQNPFEEVQNFDEIRIYSPEKKNSNSFVEVKHTENDTDSNITNFIVDVQIHRSSTPIKALEREILIEKVCSKQSLQENICDVEEILKLSKESKEEKSTETKSSEDIEVISATEKTPNLKELQIRTRRSLRSAKKRISNESNFSLQNKTSPKKRRLTKQNAKDNTIDSLKDENVISSNTADIQKNEEQSKINDMITQEKKLEFVKNELEFFSKQETSVISALQSSMNVVNVVLSQCSVYVKSESLFSESSTAKESKNSQINDKPKIVSNNFHSLPVASSSRPSVDFYETAIPCLKNIENFFNQIISLSQQITNETENFRDKFNDNKDCDKLVIALKSSLANNVETQTEDITCPKCFNILDLKSACKANTIEETSVNESFRELDNISRHFSNEKNSQKNKISSESIQENKLSTIAQISSTFSKQSQSSSGSNVVQHKKVNRQLSFSEESNTPQRRTFKRIRSPTPDSDAESVKSKKSNVHSSIRYSKLLYREDIDILFESESSDKYDLSLGSQTNDEVRKKIIQQAEKNIIFANKEKSINAEDTASNCISILEREYKDAQFDKIANSEKVVEKASVDNAPNINLDNLLGNINASEFENDFEMDFPNKTIQRNKFNETKIDNNPVLSASLFLQTETECNKFPDVDKTKSVEHLEVLTTNLAAQNAEDKKLDEEVENLTSHDVIVEDSLESGKDLFVDDDIVESTPQKLAEHKRASNLDLLGPILDIIEPPSTVTENLDWIEIAPPPPPEFQDTEITEQPKPNNANISSLTPDIFALNPLNKGFFANTSLLSGNTTNQKYATQNNLRKDTTYSENIPNTVTEKENIESKAKSKSVNIASTSKTNLNPIVIAQKEKFSPLQIIVNQNPSPKPTISSIPKHQQSILNFMKTPQKETVKPNSSTKQIINQSNTFVPIKENIPLEVCESPTPQNTSTTSVNKTVNKLSNESTRNVSLEKLKYSACIACSRLKRDEIIQIISLTQKVKAKYSRDFDKNVTHLVVSVDDQNRIYDHTIKYVLAIAHSIWVVSFAWIRDSITQNRLLPEEPYEVLDVSGKPGPKISRKTKLSNPLLRNFVFCCIPPFISVNKSDIENAILSLGGEIERNPSEFARKVGKYCLILVEAKETQNFDQYQELRDKFNVLVVDVEWFSRAVGQYEIMSVRPYMLCLEKDINDLGYPFALIASVPETYSMSMTNTNH